MGGFFFGCSGKEELLAELAREALNQIDEKRYDTEMKEDGIQDILKFGIAFSGGNVNIKTEKFF